MKNPTVALLISAALASPCLAGGNSPYIKLTSPTDGAKLAPARDQWIPLRYSIDMAGIKAKATHPHDSMVPFLTVAIPGPTPSSPADTVLYIQLAGADLTGHNVSSNDILDKLNAKHRPLDTPIVWNIVIHTPAENLSAAEASQSTFSFRVLKAAGDQHVTAKSPVATLPTRTPTPRPPR